MHIHELNGCAPTPLAYYLKALGILRLVSEQVDPKARGWWEGDSYRLVTKLSRTELVDFLVSAYEPTPMFNPWGARSGYYSGSSERTARQTLAAIERSEHERFTSYRSAIETIRRVIDKTANGAKPKDGDVQRLILALRNTLRGKSSMWMDAVAAVVKGDAEKIVVFPALFGTGGSEGSGSYTSAYMAAIEQCLLLRKWDHAILGTVFGDNAAPGCTWGQSLGQFLPAGRATPWDLLFAFEGACVVRSAISSRNAPVGNSRWVSSPFFVAPTSYGYASGAELDEYALNKGKRMPGRGEQWFPLWSQPMLGSEVVQFFAEGRALVRRAAASDGWSMARAVASLGVRRGVSEFVRFGYLQRNNLATHFAVPLGRFRVPDRPCSYVACLDDLDGWLRRLRHEARSRNAPDRLKLAERSLTDSLFAVTQEPEHPVRWQAVLIALEGVEGVQITGSGYRAGPAPKLRSEWVEAADDGSVEFRLAVAFALQARKFTTSGRPLDPIRRHWLPLDPKRPRSYATTGTGNQARLQTAVDTVLRGRNGTDDAIALVKRRLIEAAQSGERGLALRPLPGFAVHVADVRSLTCGSVDLNRALTLARALMALDRESPPRRLAPLNSADSAWPDDAWITIRLCTSPWPLPDGRNVPVDPAIFRRLESGDASTAVELALRRLRASGIYPTVRAAAASPETARLWAAALAFPISRQTAMQFVRRLDPHSLKEIA